jgi:hypothetical protein
MILLMNSTPSNVISQVATPNEQISKPLPDAPQAWSSTIPPPVPSKIPFDAVTTTSLSASIEPQYVAYNPFKQPQDLTYTLSSAISTPASGPPSLSITQGKRPIGESSTNTLNTSYATSCESCNISGRDVQYCNVCESSFCAECWLQQFAHIKNKLGPGGIPHEKTKPGVAEKVRKALAPPVDDMVREQMYSDDAPSSWFGNLQPENLSLH